MTASFSKHTDAKTMHSVPKQVAKRKTNPGQDVAIKNKVTKVDIKLKKSATKAELFLHIEGLEQRYDALEKEHDTNVDTIRLLEETISKLIEKKETVAKETQTECDKDFKCFECNFEGVSEVELKWHMNKNHGWPDIVHSEKPCEPISDKNGHQPSFHRSQKL